MTREELRTKEPLTYAVLESIGETEKFLTWEQPHQSLFCQSVEFADMASKNNVPIEEYRRRAKEYCSEIESETADKKKILELIEMTLDYAESMRKAVQG